MKSRRAATSSCAIQPRTFGQHEVSWPMDKILSPKAFFIAKLFYSSSWNENADEQLAVEKQSCETLTDTFFSERDRAISTPRE